MPEIDALFESINVRDLLAGHDLNDPTTPLSAPDLRLLINRLESHSLRIKSKVQSYLVAHHSDFSELFSLCQDAVSRTRLISDDVSDVLQLVSDRPIDVEIRSVVDEITEKSKEVKLKRESLDLVSAIVGICEALQETKGALKNGRFRFAALLRKEWSNCFDEIQEVLAKFMENAVRFELDSSRLRIKYQLNVGETAGIALSTVLEAMEVIGMLDYGCCSLWSQVVPEDASKLADFQKIIARTSQFEAALKELNFVSPSDAESRLSKYAEDVEVHFASRKKIEILAKARNLLLQCNFTIPQEIAMRNANFKSTGVESLDVNSSEHIVCLLFFVSQDGNTMDACDRTTEIGTTKP